MNPRTARQIARSLDARTELLPYVPELLADLNELGGSADEILDLLQPLGPPPGSRVLDLGCGKGTVAVRLAEQFGFQVVGVDGFDAFIDEARPQAGQRGVGERCEFRCADLRECFSSGEVFDVAMMIAVGPVAGDQEQTVSQLRTCVRPGGFMVIDDGFLADAQTRPVGYDDYADHGETVRRLTSCGDTVLRERVAPSQDIDQVNAQITEAICRRAEALKLKYPQAAELFDEYVATQHRESELATSSVIYCTWLLQKHD